MKASPICFTIVARATPRRSKTPMSSARSTSAGGKVPSALGEEARRVPFAHALERLAARAREILEREGAFGRHRQRA
jgi:hypothetical protein